VAKPGIRDIDGRTVVSTQSNAKWTRVDARREFAHQLLEAWLLGHKEHVLDQLERNPQPRRLLAAVAAIALEPMHGDRYAESARQICDHVYRER
jgi:hypothetical protein